MKAVSRLKTLVAVFGFAASLHCVAQTTSPTVNASVQSVFELAAELYPSQFGNGGALGTYQGYVYKYFADSKIYVGIKDDKIFTMGGVYGNAIKEQGSVSAVLNLLQTTKANAAKPTTPVTPTTPTSSTNGLDSSGLPNLAGGSGITFAANGITRTYNVGNSPVATSSTGYLVQYQGGGASAGLNASIYIPNKVGVYACGSGLSAATQNGYFNSSQVAWIAFTGTAFGGTPLDSFGGSCTIEVLSVSPKLEGRFIAQLFGAAAGNGKVTAGYFSAPNEMTVSSATAGTGTGSFEVTARNSTVPSKHVGTMQITQFGLAVVDGACVYSGKGSYAGSSESYIFSVTRAKGAGQVGGWELRTADYSFNATANNVTTKTIEINKTAKTVRVSDTFGTSGGASSVKVEGSVKWTDVGNVTGC